MLAAAWKTCSRLHGSLVFTAGGRLDSAMMCSFGCWAELRILPQCRMWQLCIAVACIVESVTLFNDLWVLCGLAGPFRLPSEGRPSLHERLIRPLEGRCLGGVGGVC